MHSFQSIEAIAVRDFDDRASGPARCVAWKTFQSYRIGFERKPFLLRESVEKCATRNAC